MTQQGQTIKATQLSAVASSSSSSAAESSSSDSSSSATDSSSTSQSSATGNLGITINGDFSDWYDKTKSAMKENGDNDNIKYVSLLTDDKNVYFYVEMKPQLSGGYTELQPSGYKLTVGGVVYDIDFNNNKSVSLSKGQIKELSVGIYNEKTGSYTVLNNQVAVKYQKITQEMGDSSSVDGWGAVLECEIPFSALTSSSNTAGQVITLANRNLWEGQVTASGGSTRPFILALISFLVAVGALWMIFKKQQTRSDQGSK
ncbi:MAG: Firmicu-CTERM sorting domain-containing protein [Liquorilactobacillus nagelii]|uniref:Firmicu-CTERM sorting domain-containing protein n=1 Tax=Liquorilactobacillus nagelii TaxID=82688 RepID=UPI00242FC7F8|nr:Firmicu-CTERM sorting domain-containing protein [Liquorilactobacillus nagelii]MCI1921633.1 Firmicu-CTERM sorting domain-containing protein [Liquorilactobacillus nagelii]MCI1977241.1 Firmicu-CTERM sorting domain-containing protein [Liquorilactobacillus nagelii]